MKTIHPVCHVYVQYFNTSTGQAYSLGIPRCLLHLFIPSSRLHIHLSSIITAHKTAANIPRATAPRPATLAAAPPVLSAGADEVAEAAREEAVAAETTDLTAPETEAATEEAAEAAAEGAAVAREEGMATEKPAAEQRPARAGTTSVGRLVRRDIERGVFGGGSYGQPLQPSSGRGRKTRASW